MPKCIILVGPSSNFNIFPSPSTLTSIKWNSKILMPKTGGSVQVAFPVWPVLLLQKGLANFNAGFAIGSDNNILNYAIDEHFDPESCRL